MDNYVQELINQIHDICHRIEGYLDAKAALKPNLRFVEDDDEPKVILFPSNRNSAIKEDQIKKPDADTPGTEQEFVIFSEQEMKQMPKTIKRLVLLEGKRCRLRTRKSGENSTTYQIRFRRDGYDVTACGKTIELAKANFLKKLRTAQPKKENGSSEVPNKFKDFAMYFYERFRKPKIAPTTYKHDFSRLTLHIFPTLENRILSSITPTDCENLINPLKDAGKGKTAEEIRSILSVIFKGAIAHGLMDRNPLLLVPHVKHESENGVALTKAEETTLFAGLKDAPTKIALALGLFCGLRPNEIESAKIEGPFIVAINSKRHHKRTEYKKIPICKRLEPYLATGIPRELPTPQILRRRVKEILPNHKLYDLRTTFYSRCKELGVADAARDEFVGHSLGILGNTYTDLSDTYLLKEGKKLNKW